MFSGGYRTETLGFIFPCPNMVLLRRLSVTFGWNKYETQWIKSVEWRCPHDSGSKLAVGQPCSRKKNTGYSFQNIPNVDSYFPSDTIIYELLSDESERIKDTTQEHLDVRKYIYIYINIYINIYI